MTRPMTIAACAGCLAGAVAACFVAARRGPAAATAAPLVPVVRVTDNRSAPAAVLAASAKNPIVVRPVMLSETRERALGDAAKRGGTGFFTGLRVKLLIDGPAVRDAAKVGRLKLVEATDDLGADLRDKEQLKWCEQLQDVNRFGTFDSDKGSGFEYELRLGLPARNATAIARLKGELTVLAGGQEKVVTVAAARTLAGTAVNDPALSAAGISLRIAQSQGKKDSLAVELTGDFDAIKEVKVLAADGINVMTGAWWSEAAGTRSVSYMLSRPVDDADARLELRLAVGQKKLAVPIELANLPLP
jgi:hypothetical protein